MELPVSFTDQRKHLFFEVPPSLPCLSRIGRESSLPTNEILLVSDGRGFLLHTQGLKAKSAFWGASPRESKFLLGGV